MPDAFDEELDKGPEGSIIQPIFLGCAAMGIGCLFSVAAVGLAVFIFFPGIPTTSYSGCRRVVVVGPSPDAPLLSPGVNDSNCQGLKVRSGLSAAAGAAVPVLRYERLKSGWLG